MPTQVDLYSILGVSRDANGDDIKRAYRRLARQYHPDVSSTPDTEERFKEINLAYEVLSDPQKRQQYDTYGTTGGRAASGDPFGAGFSSISDIFDFFFSGGGGFSQGFGGAATARRRDYQPGEDLHRAVHLKLEDCLADKTIELKVERRERCESCGGSRAEPGSQTTTCLVCGGRGVVVQYRDTLLGRMTTSTTCPACRGEGVEISSPCKTCRGSGLVEKSRTISVTIPAGIDDGNIMRVGGQGHSGRGAAPAGDLLVSVSLEPHEFFTRDGADLYVDLPVHYADLVQGTTIAVPTLSGEEQLRIPAGTGSHHDFVLRGQGMPRLRGHGRGNLYVRTVLAVPRKLSRKQRELLGQLKQEDLSAEKSSGGILYRLLKRK